MGYLEQIKEQFTHARAALIVGWRLGLPVFLHAHSQEHHILLEPPFLNYCYLPLAIPPEVHDPFAAMKLCALGMEANLTNNTVPWPMGDLLSIEEHLDRSEVFPAFLLVVISALVFGQRLTADSAANAPKDTSGKKKQPQEEVAQPCSGYNIPIPTRQRNIW